MDRHDEARRLDDVRRFDTLPQNLREAYRECPYFLWVPRRTKGLDIAGLVARIKALDSFEAATELNRLLKG